MSWENNLWPEWQIESEIGSGSYGKVYRIRRQDIGGTFYAALKVISVPRNDEEVRSLRNSHMNQNQIVEYYRRFARKMAQEFAVMERLKGNTNIVSYEDHKIVPKPNGIGVDVLIRMELLTPMSSIVINGECGEAEAVRIGIDMCNALAVCEREGIIHRDIKPGNIFISNHGNYKLGDFSIARMDSTYQSERSPQGTYAYMAPEMFSGKSYDKTIDIYSLGLILYRLLNNGRAPFLPDPPTALTPVMMEEANNRRLRGETFRAPINASAELSRIILKACAYQSIDRYRSAEELRADLEAYKMLLPADAVNHSKRNASAANSDPAMRSFFATAGDL